MAIAFVAKRPIQARLVRKPGRRAPIAQLGAILGSGHAMLVFGIALALIARKSSDPRLREAAKRFAKAGVIGWTLFQPTRFVLAERRPNAGGKMRFFRFHGHGVSGHAMATALVYGPIMSTYGAQMTPAKRRALSAALLGWIGIVAWSRVRLDEHYLWNSLLGTAMGLRISGAAI